MQLYEAIRRAHAAQETKSIRALSRQFGVHRRDVRAALVSAVPLKRKTPERPSPKMDQWKPVIDGWLAEDQQWPRSSVIPLGGCGIVWCLSMALMWASRRSAGM